MNTFRTFTKTAAALAIVASFGMAHAQQEERTQIQQPGSGAGPVQKPSAAATRTDDAVKQTQQPSSGMQPAPRGGKMSTVDDSVRQTQQPGMAADNTGRTPNTTNRSTTMSPPSGANSTMNAQSGMSGNDMNRNSTTDMNRSSNSDMNRNSNSSTMSSSDSNSLNTPMQGERSARSDRN